MTLSPAGDVYVSDGLDGTVYTIHPAKDELEVLVPKGNFASPQTPALAPDGKRLLVADYSLGVGIVELKSGAISWLDLPAGSRAKRGSTGCMWRPVDSSPSRTVRTAERVIRIWTDTGVHEGRALEAIEKAPPSWRSDARYPGGQAVLLHR